MTALRFLPLAAFLLSFPAAVQADEPVHVGNWLVGADSDTTCQAIANFGNLLVRISEDAGGDGSFILSSDGWPLKDYDLSPASISWDGWNNSQDIDFVPAQLEDGNWILIAETGPWFTENLAGSKHLWLKIPGVKFDDDLAIDEAPDVTTAIATCNENH